jgi:CRP/FNR family nitrogen fixation transcriptional regulator
MPVQNALARKEGRRQLAQPLSLQTGWFELIGAPTAFGRNEEVFGEGEPAEYLYKVISGGVRTYNSLSDGRRQIAAFHLPGDIFGLEARKFHSVTADAITRSMLHAVKKTKRMSRTSGDLTMIHLLLDLTTQELQRTQAHILLLLKSAEERVIGFLLDMATREACKREFDLRMSRQDMADYLGLTIETVARTLTRLENAAVISMKSSRHIVLRDRPALDRLNG